MNREDAGLAGFFNGGDQVWYRVAIKKCGIVGARPGGSPLPFLYAHKGLGEGA